MTGQRHYPISTRRWVMLSAVSFLALVVTTPVMVLVGVHVAGVLYESGNLASNSVSERCWTLMTRDGRHVEILFDRDETPKVEELVTLVTSNMSAADLTQHSDWS